MQKTSFSFANKLSVLFDEKTFIITHRMIYKMIIKFSSTYLNFTYNITQKVFSWFCSACCKHILLDQFSYSTIHKRYHCQEPFHGAGHFCSLWKGHCYRPKRFCKTWRQFREENCIPKPEWAVLNTSGGHWYPFKEHIKYSQMRIMYQQFTITKQMTWGPDLRLILLTLNFCQLEIVTLFVH